MKSLKLFLWAGIFTLSFSCVTAWADVPKLINFQGRLSKDTLGTPVKDSTYSILFTIYDVPVGGANLWSETQSVATKGGTFNVNLGSSTVLPDNIFDDTTRYLAMKVGTDAEMTPRQRMVSTAYVYQVRTVDGATGGTISGTTYFESPYSGGGTGQVHLQSSGSEAAITLEKAVNDTARWKIKVGDNSDAASRFEIDEISFPGVAHRFTIMDSTGNVGIGTTDPQVKLQVDSGIVSFTHQSAVSVINSADFTVPNLTMTKVPFNSEDYDRQNEYDATTNYRFTATVSGDYLICSSLIGSTSFAFQINIFKNGSWEKSIAASHGANIGPGCGVLHLEPGDYIEIFTNQSTGGTRTFLTNSTWSYLTINKIN